MLNADQMMPHVLDFYVRPAVMTSTGGYESRFDELPHDVAALARAAQGLLIHEHMAQAYGVELSDEDRRSVYLRPVERMMERVLARDDRPLATARPVEVRLAGNCRHFTVLMVAMLRAQGVPARARCGFGGYFVTDRFEDHWVCEYWHAGQQRWILVDAQIDQVQQRLFRPDFNLLDVPRDRFVIAGDAWVQCRAGESDPAKYGLSILNEAGLWWIAANLVRDAAALNSMEMLPGDVWGVMPRPEDSIDENRLALFDRLAAVTRKPDATFDEMRSLYNDDDRLRVPPTVYNAGLNREDTV